MWAKSCLREDSARLGDEGDNYWMSLLCHWDQRCDLAALWECKYYCIPHHARRPGNSDFDRPPDRPSNLNLAPYSPWLRVVVRESLI